MVALHVWQKAAGSLKWLYEGNLEVKLLVEQIGLIICMLNLFANV